MSARPIVGNIASALARALGVKNNVFGRETLYLGGTGTTNAASSANWFLDAALTVTAGRIPTSADIVEFRGASRQINGGFECHELHLTQPNRVWDINCDVISTKMVLSGYNTSWNQGYHAFTGHVYVTGDNCYVFFDIMNLPAGITNTEDAIIEISGDVSGIAGNSGGTMTISGADAYCATLHYGSLNCTGDGSHITNSGQIESEYTSTFSGDNSYSDAAYLSGDAIFSGNQSVNYSDVYLYAYFSGTDSLNLGYVYYDGYFTGLRSENTDGSNNGSVGNAYVSSNAGGNANGIIGGTVRINTYPYP